jgi:very-short-patch-repair endonuclease
MIIYLAGKVSLGDWRHDVVKDLRQFCGRFLEDQTAEWPILKNSIGSVHSYSGPYFISCDHGCSHGPGTHGYGINPCMGEWGPIDYEDENELEEFEPAITNRRRLIVERCEQAIERSDIIFAWIDDLTAFGTIFELGYAADHQIPTYLAISKKNKKLLSENLWFAIRSTLRVMNSQVVYFDTVHEAFDEFLRDSNYKIGLDKIESPIEMKFFEAMRDKTSELVPQWEVNASGHNYRLDFAIPSKKIAFELDGHEFHKTKEQRTNDTRRERNLQKEGWKVIRFTGTDIHNNLDKCVADACQLISGETS